MEMRILMAQSEGILSVDLLQFLTCSLTAYYRDRLVNLQPSTGYRFNGNGYTIIDGRSYSLRSRSDIQLTFKTYASEGLLFVVGKDKTFTSLEVRNGKILYQVLYNMA